MRFAESGNIRQPQLVKVGKVFQMGLATFPTTTELISDFPFLLDFKNS